MEGFLCGRSGCRWYQESREHCCWCRAAARPARTTAAGGTTVTWENGDGIAHTVTSATGSADTYDMALSSGTVTHQFATAGTYNYYCKFHGVNGAPPTGMHGTITVQ